MGIFDGMLLCTDLDGTLLSTNKTISDKNVEAIEYFKREGGKFTFASGRMPYFMSFVANKINPNAPFGCVSGAGLYDFFEDRYIWKNPMADGVEALIELIDREFPTVGIQLNTFDFTYFCKDNVTMQAFRDSTGCDNVYIDYHNVKEPIGKIIFGSESDDEILAMEKALKAHPLAYKFDFVRPERELFEILPKRSSKGLIIEKLVECLGLDINKTVAVGDYDNDIAMFSAAKLAVAVENACENAKAAANAFTVSNDESAIADVIYGIRDGRYVI